jgi:hypothetical protein
VVPAGGGGGGGGGMCGEEIFAIDFDAQEIEGVTPPVEVVITVLQVCVCVSVCVCLCV